MRALLLAIALSLPFLAGALVAGTGILVRRAIHADSPARESVQPVRDAFGRVC